MLCKFILCFSVCKKNYLLCHACESRHPFTANTWANVSSKSDKDIVYFRVSFTLANG